MPDSIIPFPQIVFTAAIALAASLLVLNALNRGLTQLSIIDILALAGVVAISILLWRSAANVGFLNDDPIPFVGPNDVLCPIVTFIFLAIYLRLRGIDPSLCKRTLTWLTLLSFVVNVLLI